jgi:nucleotide-binding universal stress UspA family protein
MYRRILIAHDGSDGAFRALEAAIDIAKRYKAELHMISVEELPRFPGTIDEVIEEKDEANHRFEGVIAEARARAKARRVKIEAHVVAGHVVPAIVEFLAKNRFDLLVVGFMGHTALYNRIIGSTTDRLVELAPCPVLVIK